MVIQRGFGTRLRILGERRALTQVQLAKEARLSQEYFTRLECGTKVNPSLDVLARLAIALKVKIGELVGSEEADYVVIARYP